MPSPLVLLIAGVVLFFIAIALFRVGPRPDRSVGSIWTHGSVAARLGLVAWWASVALLLASFVQLLRG